MPTLRTCGPSAALQPSTPFGYGLLCPPSGSAFFLSRFSFPSGLSIPIYISGDHCDGSVVALWIFDVAPPGSLSSSSTSTSFFCWLPALSLQTCPCGAHASFLWTEWTG
ncbi:hypothetical protein M9458_029763, partial [Cirrhinus mrigala]